MKVQTILAPITNQSILSENAVLTFRDLNSLQSTTLIRVARGKVDYETASPREQAIMDELASLGLLDDLSYEPTEDGMRVAQIASRYFSRRTGGEVQKPRRYTDADGPQAELELMADDVPGRRFENAQPEGSPLTEGTKKVDDDGSERAVEVEKLKKGTFVKRQPTSSKVYKLAGYDAGSRTYRLDDTDDISRDIGVKRGTKLWIGFDY